jgi:formylglycine-generating enzyme required for sulfatase activity/tRNA A-37 threonylcarbamoyl transferase component Bud32
MSVKTAPSLASGAAIGPYRIAHVFAGGAAAEAIDTTSQRGAVIKRLPDSLFENPDLLVAYERIVDSVRAIRHPGVLTLHSVEKHDGAAFLVMDFAVRGSIVERLKSLGRLPWMEATRIIASVARVIEDLHSRGIVHGAIRPSNLLVGSNGSILVSDIGGGVVRPSNSDYTAPEQLTGAATTAAADVYSLGATYFALLSGHAPFADVEGEAALADAHANRPVPNVRAGSPDMPLRCEMVVQRAMAKSPGARYPSVAALRADLEAALAAEQDALPSPRQSRLRMQKARHAKSNLWGRARGLLPSASLVTLTLLCAIGYFVLPFFHTSKPHDRNRSENPMVLKLPTITNSLNMQFVRVPAAVFQMGDPMVADGKPHPVRLTQPYFIGVAEVTQREYRVVMGENPSSGTAEANPVDSVSWEEAREFCERLSRSEGERSAGRSYRLPTEAEWEFACRGGTRTLFAFGNQLRLDQANTRASGLMHATPAGTYPPNAFGLKDMHGNLWEWCSDWYKTDYYAESPIDDPQGPTTGLKRVVRGGSWMVGAEDCLSARRGDMYAPTERSPGVGFRIVCIAPGFEPDEKENR